MISPPLDIKPFKLVLSRSFQLQSEMGVYLASPFSIYYHFSPRNLYHQTTVKFLLFNGKKRDTLHFKTSMLRPQPRRTCCCKLEYPDFEERTSPNEIASLLDCTSWSRAGPGLMDAATKGALQACTPVGGFKIGKEAAEWTATNFHPYLASETYLTCRFFSARKHGLVDAAFRASNSDRTAVVALPGGVGTLDEMFEIVALIQLERIGSLLLVPFLLVNYDSFYSKLLEFLDDCEMWGTVSKGEVPLLWRVCGSNSEALGYLTDFYGLSPINKDGETKVETACGIIS